MLTLCRALIRIGRAIVPGAYRHDWTREWQAELHYRAASLPDGVARRAQLDLVARCAGAVVHAAWLRKEEWSPTMLLQDVRYAVRGLCARPGFAIVCVMLLAIGIGANTTVFSVVNGVLLAPLPYREPDRLVQIWETNPALNWTQATVAPANMLDWRARNRSFEGIAYYTGTDGKGPQVYHLSMAEGPAPERVRAMMVSGNFFGVLGAPPRMGRVLLPGDAGASAPVPIVLSDAFWRRRFGADPSVLGRRVPIDGTSAEIVGVMPPGFHIPGADVQIWAPHRISEDQLRRMRRPHWVRTVARLKRGVSLEQARADMTRIATELEREYPDTNRQMGVGLGPLHDWFVGDVRQAVVLLMSAVAVVLLIACSNVAGLLLARATGRRREIAIRLALGAGRVRLVRQLLTESLLMAASGGVLGLAFAEAALRVLRRSGPTDIPRLSTVTIDAWVLLFVVAVICATAIVVGLVPALQGARQVPSDSLKSGERTTAGSTTAGRRFIIVGEVALSVVLLAAAGLLLRSFIRLQAVDPGVDVSRTVSFRISLPDQYDDPKAAAFFTEAEARLRTIGGVEAAGATARLALEGYVWTGDLYIEGRPDLHGRELRHKSVTPGFFDAAGLPLVRGRPFGSQDTSSSAPVAVINEALARRYFAGTDPVGRRISYSRPSAETRWVTIVGVVADEKQDALDAPVEPEVYSPHLQDVRQAMTLVLRTAVEPAGLLAPIRREIAGLDPTVALYDLKTMEEVVAESLAEERFSTLLVGGFAVAALLLAAIGLYGILAFTVTERTREIGVRLALGASRPEVVRMVVRSGLRLVAAGVVLGLAGALLVSRTLEAFLFETEPADPLVLAGVAGAMLAAALGASYLPAARASRVDPALSLRAE